MPTRFNSTGKTNYNSLPLPSGYEKDYGSADFFLPSCGIEDVDSSLFELFDKEISPSCGGVDSAPLKKVPVVFAAGEKWAMLKRGRPLRDRDNTLVLPLITILRKEINQSPDDYTSRGINQQVGEIVIKRRLDKSDRNYQSLINRLFFNNQSNVAAIDLKKSTNQFVSSREMGQLVSQDFDVSSGALLKPNLKNNVYETIVAPTPQFYTAKYEVTVWTQYMQHSNQILERIVSSYLPQGQSWKLETPKGYWFVASVEGGSFANETNFDDMSQQERFIKYTFSINVPAYIFASNAPGNPVPVKRYVSNPIIIFDTESFMPEALPALESEESKYSLGSDDPSLPLDTQENDREDQQQPGWRHQKVYPVNEEQDTNNPALQALPRGYNRIKVVGKGPNGETVYSGYSLNDFENIVE